MTDDERFGLSSKTRRALGEIFKTHEQIEKVLIYGSRAKGNYRPGSDVDLVILGPHADLSLRLKIAQEIDDLLLPYTFDLALMHEVENADLIDHIRRIGQSFYER